MLIHMSFSVVNNQLFLEPTTGYRSVMKLVTFYTNHQIVPCCGPSSTKSISIVYKDNENLIKEDIPHMSVVSCDFV